MPTPDSANIVDRLKEAATEADDMLIEDIEALMLEAAEIIVALRKLLTMFP